MLQFQFESKYKKLSIFSSFPDCHRPKSSPWHSFCLFSSHEIDINRLLTQVLKDFKDFNLSTTPGNNLGIYPEFLT